MVVGSNIMEETIGSTTVTIEKKKNKESDKIKKLRMERKASEKRSKKP